MTWEELADYAAKQLNDEDVVSTDWRPAWEIYINDIVKVKDGVPCIPLGIRIWLSNGDSIIYVANGEEQQEDETQEDTKIP